MPLGTELDQLFQPGIEPGSSRRIDAPVRFAEDRAPARVVPDRPSMFVQEPVMVSAQQDEIAQVGGATIGPVDLVVPMNPTVMGTAGETASSITEPELPTQPTRDHPGATPHPEHSHVVGDAALDDPVT